MIDRSEWVEGDTFVLVNEDGSPWLTYRFLEDAVEAVA